MNKIAFALVLALAGCQSSDEDIRADIATKARQNLDFAGLNYTVKDGAAYFSGSCPSPQALEKIRQTIKNIHVLKSVNYYVSIRPVSLDTLTPVKLRTDSVLAMFPQVTAEVRPDGITLKGNVLAQQRRKLLLALRKQGLGPLTDSLKIYL